MNDESLSPGAINDRFRGILDPLRPIVKKRPYTPPLPLVKRLALKALLRLLRGTGWSVTYDHPSQ